MNSDIKMAGRYHWNSEKVASSFVSEPHSGIICNKAHQRVLDMTASESIETQKTSLDLIRGNPQNLISSIKELNLGRNPTLDDWISSNKEKASKIKLTDSFEMPRLLNWKIINKAYDIQPKNYEEFVSIEGGEISREEKVTALKKLSTNLRIILPSHVE